MNTYFTAFKKCLDFKSKTNREDFLLFASIDTIFVMAAYGADMIFMKKSFFVTIYVLLTCVPRCAICIRRLHDTGKSGWWLLMTLIGFPILIPLFFHCTFDVMTPFILIEGIVSVFMMYLYLLPSKNMVS